MSVAALSAVLLLGVVTDARAQWYAAAYLGGNHTNPAAVSIDRPADGLSLQFHEVRFAARALTSPQYYGLRFGRLFGARRRIGLEVEFIHLKVISETSRRYDVTGEAGAFDATALSLEPMNTLVARYAMTHGLNFFLVNLVARLPVRGGRVALVARAGGGPTLPHAESTIAGETLEQYEYGGPGAHAAAGVDVPLRGRLSAVVEYKITYAKPEIAIAHGTGRTTALTHQVAIGLAFGLSR